MSARHEDLVVAEKARELAGDLRAGRAKPGRMDYFVLDPRSPGVLPCCTLGHLGARAIGMPLALTDAERRTVVRLLERLPTDLTDAIARANDCTTDADPLSWCVVADELERLAARLEKGR